MAPGRISETNHGETPIGMHRLRAFFFGSVLPDQQVRVTFVQSLFVELARISGSSLYGWGGSFGGGSSQKV